MGRALDELTAAGVSIWLDDLARTRIISGNLTHMIDTACVRGVTTNPTIFEKALASGSSAYGEQIAMLAAADVSPADAVRTLTSDDVRAACDLFLDVWRESDGVDGRVSLEVDPRLAHDTQGTVTEAALLWDLVDRPNVMIKIPATRAGLPAITATLARGISVNVTLIFSVDRYRDVMTAHAEGLEQARANGHFLPTIHSVASFFVSRVDTEVDRRLEMLATPAADRMRGTAAIANAQLAWAAFCDFTASPRWSALADEGARSQRPLWASTGVKDPAYDDTRYVVELVADGVVNTMPESTLAAVADHGVVRGDTLDGTEDQAREVFAELERLGIDMTDVFRVLEDEGVEKFVASGNELLATVATALRDAH